MEKKTFEVAEEFANDSLATIMGGASAEKISITISLTKSSLISEAEKKKDSDSDADEVETKIFE
ncbi:MAG: hypothetical protein UD961_00725 [Bacteroidales bacterium]|nr:hypothetical protein [Bacteroidales bacterium]